MITFIGYLVQGLYKMLSIGWWIFMLKCVPWILHELYNIVQVLLTCGEQPTPQRYSDISFNTFQIVLQWRRSVDWGREHAHDWLHRPDQYSWGHLENDFRWLECELRTDGTACTVQVQSQKTIFQNMQQQRSLTLIFKQVEAWLHLSMLPPPLVFLMIGRWWGRPAPCCNSQQARQK